MKGFRTAGAAQRFLAAFSDISPHFQPARHRKKAATYRLEMITRLTIWNHITDTTRLPTTA